MREKWCVSLFVPAFETQPFLAFIKESAYLQEKKSLKNIFYKNNWGSRINKDKSNNQTSNKKSYLYFRRRSSHECTLMQPDEWIVWTSKKLATFCRKAINKYQRLQRFWKKSRLFSRCICANANIAFVQMLTLHLCKCSCCICVNTHVAFV